MTLEFSLTQEQEAIRDLAHEFAVNEIRPVAAHFDETEEFPYEVVKKAHKLGLSPAAFLPEEYGGQGLDFLTELMLNEELSWGCAGIAVCSSRWRSPSPASAPAAPRSRRSGGFPSSRTPTGLCSAGWA